MADLPAVSITASSKPGRRATTLDLARELERRNFGGIYCSAAGTGFALCHSLAHATDRIPFGTAIANIYSRSPADTAQCAAYVEELAPGRFTLGLGVGHRPFNLAFGNPGGKPLEDMGLYLDAVRAGVDASVKLPRVVLAALRPKMVTLATFETDGIILANAPLSQLASVIAPAQTRVAQGGFRLENIISVCVTDDRAAAIAALRAAVSRFVVLPNYRRFWRDFGYGDEMRAIESSLAAAGGGPWSGTISEELLEDIAIFGDKATVRKRMEAWSATGVGLVVAPISTTGDVDRAFAELFQVFA